MAVPTRDFPDLFRAPGGVPAGTKCRRKADWVYLASQSPLHGCAMLSVSKKWPKPLFRVFARGCMHAFGAHLPLEKCKKPRTGRGFLRIYRGRADDPFRYYIGFSTVWAWLCHAVPPLHKGGPVSGRPYSLWSGGRTAILSLPGWTQPAFVLLPGAAAQYDCPGTGLG